MKRQSSTAEIERLIGLLSDSSRAEPPATFPTDPAIAHQAGMYVWWADDAGRQVLGLELGSVLPSLLYVGQAGATRWPSGVRSSATLASRIGSQHIRGNAKSSHLPSDDLRHPHVGSQPRGRRARPAGGREQPPGIGLDR